MPHSPPPPPTAGSTAPDGLDSLYFWGDYLHERGREAIRHLPSQLIE
jgi:hypothetical protein